MTAILGWFLLDRWSVKHGFSGAGEFVKNVSSNYWQSFDAKYETVEITISESDFSNLEKQREKHLERGIITKSKDRFVPAIISHKGKKIKCKLRLKGHMLDHLQDSKWSFRVKTSGGDAFQGMKIFSLMHPGTRNYIYEWIYHQLLTDEGIATIRYSFINLRVNGEKWGIYAVEENFASELLGHNELPDGPIVGFNPDLYWHARLNGFDHKKLDMENLTIHASMIEAYDEDEQFKSEESRNNYVEAIVKLEQFKRGELTTSEVFDISKLAKFHAIMDLVGGQFSLDWSDVKYYYNPITQKVEPVGYESFSVRNTAQLAGSSKFSNEFDVNTEWHDRLFSDPEFFALYLKELKRISKKEYLERFFSKHDRDLQNSLAILYSEFPYKKLPIQTYFTNQSNIASLLATPIMPFVFLEKIEKDSLYFTFGCNSVLPIQIHELLIGEKKMKLDRILLSSRKKNKPVVFKRFAIHCKDSIDEKDYKDLKLVAGYPGIKKTVKLDIKPLPFDGNIQLPNDFINQEANHTTFDFIKVDEEKKQIILSSGKHIIDRNLIFPKGYQVIGNSPLTLVLNNHAFLITQSGLKLNGTEEAPVLITSEDSTGGGILLLQATKGSYFSYVDFENLQTKTTKGSTHDAILLSYESGVKLIACRFQSSARVGLKSIRSRCAIQNSEFYGMTEKAIEVHFADIKFNGLLVSNCQGEAIDLNSVNGAINNLKIWNSETGLKVDNACFVKVEKAELSKIQLGFYCTDNSILKLVDVKLDDLKVGFRSEKKSDVYGPALIKVTKLKKSKVDKLSEADKKSKVIIQ